MTVSADSELDSTHTFMSNYLSHEFSNFSENLVNFILCQPITRISDNLHFITRHLITLGHHSLVTPKNRISVFRKKRSFPNLFYALYISHISYVFTNTLFLILVWDTLPNICAVFWHQIVSLTMFQVISIDVLILKLCKNYCMVLPLFSYSIEYEIVKII